MLTVAVDGQRVAFYLSDVTEVLPAAETAHLPHAPSVVRGLLNLRGEPLPVMDLRARLGLPTRPVDPDDHVVVCRIGGRAVGVWVDRADDVSSLDTDALVPMPEDAARHVAGAAMLEDGVLLVTDVESFLDAEETVLLDQALAAATEVGARA